MTEPLWQQRPSPKKKTSVGLLVGIVVGVLGLVGGGITALVLSRDKDDHGGVTPSAAAEAFVQAYNSAVEASAPSELPLDEYVCPASHDYFARTLEDGIAQRVRLKIESVRGAAEDGRAVVDVSGTGDGGPAGRTTVLAVRTDGRWKVCDPEMQMGAAMIRRRS